jgi:hypothetical protein
VLIIVLVTIVKVSSSRTLTLLIDNWCFLCGALKVYGIKLLVYLLMSISGRIFLIYKKTLLSIFLNIYKKEEINHFGQIAYFGSIQCSNINQKKEYFMKKKTILIVVILLTAITTAFAQTAADFSVELTADGNGVLIKRYLGKVLTVKVPDIIEGMPVREIGKEAFHGLDTVKITSVILPQGLTKIWERAFIYQVNLTSVVIPNTVIEIGDEAFRQCSVLKSVDIPDSVTVLGIMVFYQSGIERFTLGKGITVIPVNLFYGCKLQSAVVIHEGVTEIGNMAFGGNYNFTTLTLPSTIKKIGSGAFLSCGSLTTVTIPDSVETIEFIFTYAGDNNAFENCAKLNLASQSAIKRRGYTGKF